MLKNKMYVIKGENNTRKVLLEISEDSPKASNYLYLIIVFQRRNNNVEITDIEDVQDIMSFLYMSKIGRLNKVKENTTGKIITKTNRYLTRIIEKNILNSKNNEDIIGYYKIKKMLLSIIENGEFDNLINILLNTKEGKQIWKDNRYIILQIIISALQAQINKEPINTYEEKIANNSSEESYQKVEELKDKDLSTPVTDQTEKFYKKLEQQLLTKYYNYDASRNTISDFMKKKGN